MMKLRVLCVFTLCIWLGQICAGSREPFTEQSIRDLIYDVSEQFVSDFLTIEERFQDNLFIHELFAGAISTLSRQILREAKSKIDVNQVKAYSTNQNFSSALKSLAFDYLRLSQLILSKQLPPERYNGIINLLFACTFDSATTEEIQSALNYLYGIDAEAIKTSFLDSHNLPKLTSEDDCPMHSRMSPTIDALSRLVDVKPKVKEDFLAVREQFPCNGFAVAPLEYFVDVLQRSGGQERKISACMIKQTIANRNYVTRKREIEGFVETTEAVLSTRLPVETIRGIINIQKSTIPDTPIDEIEKALEYVYDDVPKSECPTAEGSTLEAD